MNQNPKKIVIQVKYGGLGDHLFYSHIPRIAKTTKKYDEVWISSKSPFRDGAYKELVWGLNPYVDGFIDESGTHPEPQRPTPDENVLDTIMFSFGLDDGIRFHEPELYYTQRKKYSYLSEKTLYDPNYVSFVGKFDAKDLRKMLAKKHFNIDYQMTKRNKSIFLEEITNTLQSHSLEEFCDFILSCNKLFCLTSGTATLAAALKKSAIAFYGIEQDKIFHHSKLHEYVFVNKTGMDKIYYLLNKALCRCKNSISSHVFRIKNKLQ